MIEIATRLSSYLATQITSLACSANLFVGSIPTSPFDCAAIVPTGGPFDPSDGMSLKTFQIVYRHDKQALAMSMINSIYDAFTKTGGWNLTGCNDGRFYPNHEPGPFFKDENEFFVYSLNFTLIVPKRY